MIFFYKGGDRVNRHDPTTHHHKLPVVRLQYCSKRGKKKKSLIRTNNIAQKMVSISKSHFIPVYTFSKQQTQSSAQSQAVLGIFYNS